MVNIIFDGSYIVHKNVFTLHKADCLYGDFHKALTMNIQKFIDMLPGCRIHLVFDGKYTWRKQFDKEYKANRVKDDTFDWEWVFKELDVWIEDAKENTNWNIYKEDGLEGDDWIMALVKYNNKQKESNIVIASDKDLLQLLKWSPNYINVQLRDIMSQEKAYFPEGYEIFLKENEDNNSEDDLFDMSNNKHSLSDFLNYILKSWKIEEINTNKFLFEKIIKGDKGDNIQSVYQKMTKTGKLQGIGDGGAIKVWNAYSEQYGETFKTTDDSFIDKMIECIELKEKKSFDDEIKNGIKKRIKYNVKMMELNVKNYPEDVLETMMEQISQKV